MPKKNGFSSFLTRNVFALGLVSLFTDLSTEMSYAIIPIFLKDVLKAQPVFIGLIEAIAESTASILKTFSGYISDRLKKRKLFILAGYSFSALVKPLLALATQGWHVLLVRFADRFGKGIRTAPRDALIAESTSAEFYGRTYGFHRAMDTLGAILGPLFAFLILGISHQNYRLLFALAFIPGFIAVLIIIFSVRDILPERVKSLRFSLKEINPRLKIFFIIIIIFTLGNSSDAFLILRAKEVGLSVNLIPILWLVFNVSYFLWSYPAGVISDRIGRKKTLVFGFLIYSITYSVLAFNNRVALLWPIFIIYGLYYGFTEGNLRALVADLSGSEHRGTIFGIYHTVIGITFLPANLLMGYLWQKFGFNIALLAGASLSLISAILLTILVKPGGRY
ncbi:MAG: MFS transporter [candidate division WOR-3 bacterium]|nr:MFS transporter [candidate division WOR-3 bacterium]